MNIKELLIGKQNADQEKSLKLIQRAWPWIVGDSIASKSRPVKLSDQCLVINVDSASIQSELSFLKLAVTNRIMEKHNIRITDVKVKR
jgi:predicted nucleic acid-binding Zn ribbon protein